MCPEVLAGFGAPLWANTPLLIFLILISVVLDFFHYLPHFWNFYLKFYIQFYLDFPATHPILHFGRFYCIWNAMDVNIFMAFDNTLVQLVVIMILSNQNGILRKSRAVILHPFSILR